MTDDLEHRLEQGSSAVPSPVLRQRILLAIDESLPKKVPATKFGQSGEEDCLASPNLVAGTFFEEVRIPGWAWAAAVLLGVALVAPVVVGAEALRRAASARPAPHVVELQRLLEESL